MDSTQIIIIFVSTSLTILLIILGIQVFFILKEVQISVQRINKMLDDFGRVSGMVGDSAEHMGGFLSGLKAGFSAFSNIKKQKGDKGE